MRLFAILFLIITVSTEAKRKRTSKPRPIETEEINQKQPSFEHRGHDDSDKNYMLPVPFGHIYKEGFEDPKSSFRGPLDFLELNTYYVNDGPYARQFIKKNPNKVTALKDGLLPKSIPPPIATSGQNSPPMDSSDERFANVADGQGFSRNDQKNDSVKPFWNFDAILTRNLQEPPKYRIGDGMMPRLQRAQQLDVNPASQAKSDFFNDNSFNVKKNSTKHNFTTCNEFGKRAKFHPNDIVNLNWVPFYIWSLEDTGVVLISRIHKFTFPTVKFVKNFKNDVSSVVNKSIDWEQPKLMMKQGDMEMLLIAADRKGLFYDIQADLPTHIKGLKGSYTMPTNSLRLKIVDPYLAIMYCDFRYATIMAISGTEPKTREECIAEAAKLKIVGKGFPVRRNLKLEAAEARWKQAENFERSQMKTITAEDQMNAAWW